MKRRWIGLPLLLGLLLLTACRAEPEELTAAVTVAGQTAAGSLTGTLAPDGAGRGVLRFSDWIYEGTFTDNGGLLDGETRNCPWTLVIAGEDVPGRYTGALEGGSPVGLGSFRADNGAVYTGRIFGQAAVEGTAEDLPCTLTLDGIRYTGRYNGPVENGALTGLGRFRGENAAGQSYAWEGGWDDGLPSGAGTLSADRLLTVVEGREQTGVYAGAAVGGVPQGEGEFRSVNGEGVTYTYTGHWSDGRMDGQGTLIYDAANYFIRSGTFTAGRFTPTWVEALAVVGTMEPAFTLTQAQTAFLEAHPELWEAESRMNFYNSEYNSSLDRTYRLRHCFQTPETMAEPRWLTHYSLKILNAYFGPAFPGGPELTRITATDDSYQMIVRIIVPGTAEGAAPNRRISLIGLPLQLSTYTTVLGAENTCLVMVAGDVLISG